MGLSSEEARQKLAVFGPNEPVVVRRDSILRDVLRRFGSPLVLILIGASIASAVLADFGNAAIVLSIVTISIFTEYVQTRRSQRATDALRTKVAVTATCLRDGSWREVPRRELVPGDVVRLTAGDMVPADAEIFEARDLHVSEAPLTGESLPVEKQVSPLGSSVLMGSSVVSGHALARPVAQSVWPSRTLSSRTSPRFKTLGRWTFFVATRPERSPRGR